MKRFFAAAIFVLASSLLSPSALAQSKTAKRPTPAGGYPAPVVVPDEFLAEALRQNEGREDRVLKKGLLAPSIDDRMAWAGFLRPRNTGLVRLLPGEVYDDRDYHTRNPAKISGGGAYYSFAKLTHVYGYGSDIELARHNLSVGFAGADYGLLVDLGNVPIETISQKIRALRSSQVTNRPNRSRKLAEARRFRIPKPSQ